MKMNQREELETAHTDLLKEAVDTPEILEGLSSDELDRLLEQMNVDAPRLIEVSERIVQAAMLPQQVIDDDQLALDRPSDAFKDSMEQYISSYIKPSELPPTILRRRLVPCAVMAGISVIVAGSLSVLLDIGVIIAANSIQFAHFVLGGSLLMTLLAIVVAIHLIVEAYVHQWVKIRSLEERNAAMSTTIREIILSDSPAGKVIMLHLARYANIGDILPHLHLRDHTRS
jgi:hypothetical protein